MMGDYGGYGAVLDIAPSNSSSTTSLRDRYDYSLYAIQFQTTNAVVAKLIVGGIWLALVVLQLMVCAMSCCIACCHRRRKKKKID